MSLRGLLGFAVSAGLTCLFAAKVETASSKDGASAQDRAEAPSSLGVFEILTAAQLCNICWEPLISDLDILANDFGNLPCTVGP